MSALIFKSNFATSTHYWICKNIPAWIHAWNPLYNHESLPQRCVNDIPCVCHLIPSYMHGYVLKNVPWSNKPICHETLCTSSIKLFWIYLPKLYKHFKLLEIYIDSSWFRNSVNHVSMIFESSSFTCSSCFFISSPNLLVSDINVFLQGRLHHVSTITSYISIVVAFVTFNIVRGNINIYCLNISSIWSAIYNFMSKVITIKTITGK
jgi:hypothetical protein